MSLEEQTTLAGLARIRTLAGTTLAGQWPGVAKVLARCGVQVTQQHGQFKYVLSELPKTAPDLVPFVVLLYEGPMRPAPCFCQIQPASPRRPGSPASFAARPANVAISCPPLLTSIASPVFVAPPARATPPGSCAVLVQRPHYAALPVRFVVLLYEEPVRAPRQPDARPQLRPAPHGASREFPIDQPHVFPPGQVPLRALQGSRPAGSPAAGL